MTRPSATLREQVDRSVVDDRQRAVRALLRRPLLTAARDREAFLLVRQHAAWLREWFAREPAWRLIVDAEHARLHKYAADDRDGTRAAHDPNGNVAFSRVRYVIWCLALAAIERSDRQTTLGTIADQIHGLVSSNSTLKANGVEFTVEDRRSRSHLVAVLRSLIDWQVITRVRGDESQYLQSHEHDALYDIQRPVLASLLTVQRGPSTIDVDGAALRRAEITREFHPDTADAENRRIRSFLMRRLLDDPVLYYADLNDSEREYLQHQRPRILREIHEATGLHAEVRAEGIAMVDEQDNLADVRMPEQGTTGHHTLLLAEYLCGRLHGMGGEAPRVGRAELERHTAELIQQHKRHWRKAAAEPGAERSMTEAAIDRLSALGLVRIADGLIEPRPAIHRYALVEEVPVASLEQSDLFSGRSV